MTSSDKDFRFMATNDLMSELQKDNIKLDDDSERKVVRMLLKVKMTKLFMAFWRGRDVTFAFCYFSSSRTRMGRCRT